MDDIKLLALLHLAEAFAAGDISRDQYMSAIAKLHEEEGTRSLTKSWSAHDDDMIPLSQVGRHSFMDKSWSFLDTFSVSNRTFSIAKAFEFVDDLDDLLMLKASGKGLPVGEKWQSATGRWWVKEQRGNEIRTVRTKAPEVKGPASTTPQGQSGTAATPRPRAKRKATPVVGPPKPRAKPKSISPDEVNSFVSRARSGKILESKVHEELATMSQASINAIKAKTGAKIGGNKAQQAMSLAKRLIEMSSPSYEQRQQQQKQDDRFIKQMKRENDKFDREQRKREADRAKTEEFLDSSRKLYQELGGLENDPNDLNDEFYREQIAREYDRAKTDELLDSIRSANQELRDLNNESSDTSARRQQAKDDREAFSQQANALIGRQKRAMDDDKGFTKQARAEAAQHRRAMQRLSRNT